MQVRQPFLSITYPKRQRFKQWRSGQNGNAKMHNNICNVDRYWKCENIVLSNCMQAVLCAPRRYFQTSSLHGTACKRAGVIHIPYITVK